MAHGLRDGAHAVRCGQADRFDHRSFAVSRVICAVDFDLVKPGQATFHRSQRLLHGFVDGAADGHGFTDGFHRRGQVWLGAREFLKSELRNFGHNIVDGWLKRRWGDFGDVVVELVQRETHRQFCSDFGNWETGGFGRKR